MIQSRLPSTGDLHPKEVLDALPVFPLPNAVFFPGTLLPLHVFEPRYRAMVAHAMETEQRIGIALLKPGYEAEYHAEPPFHDVIAVGEVVMLRMLPDGRSNLVLKGLGRARVLEELETPHEFRVARVQVQGAELSGQQGRELARGLATVRQLFGTVVARVPQLNVQDADAIFAADADPDQVIDAIASAVPAEPVRKQEMLEELNLVRRAELLASVLAEAVADTLSEPRGET